MEKLKRAANFTATEEDLLVSIMLTLLVIYCINNAI